MDLMPFVNKAGCECLNESDESGFDNCLVKDTTYLESDCDEQVSLRMGSPSASPSLVQSGLNVLKLFTSSVATF